MSTSNSSLMVVQRRAMLAMLAGPVVPPVVAPAKPEKAWKKLLVSGTVAFTFELCGGHYLEFGKIARQTSGDSYLEITRRMVQHKGIAGVLDGYFPWGAIQCFVKGASFGFGQAVGKSLLQDKMSDYSATILSGGFGGGFQGIVLSPLLLLKTRVMTDPAFRQSGGIVATTLASSKVGINIVRKEGPMVLMKGSGVFTIKRVFDWTTRYFFAEVVTHEYQKFMTPSGGPRYKLSMTEKGVCDFMGGAMSATATIPIDVLVATIQDAGKAGQKVSVIDTWKEKMRQGGVASLVRYSTRGFVFRVAHVALTTMLMKNISTAVYKAVS